MTCEPWQRAQGKYHSTTNIERLATPLQHRPLSCPNAGCVPSQTRLHPSGHARSPWPSCSFPRRQGPASPAGVELSSRVALGTASTLVPWLKCCCATRSSMTRRTLRSWGFSSKNHLPQPQPLGALPPPIDRDRPTQSKDRSPDRGLREGPDLLVALCQED